MWAYYTLPGDTVQSDTLLTPQVRCEGPGNCGDVVVGGELENYFIGFGDVHGCSLVPRQYEFKMTYVNLDGDETDSVMATINFEVTEGTRNYIYISGPSSNLMVAAEATTPLPVQDK